MNAKVIEIYSFVGVASVAMVALFAKVGSHVPETELPPAINTGKEEVYVFYQISEDIDLTTQDGSKVKLSDIKGEVTVLAQFFAVCPMCTERSGTDLLEMYKRFGDHPDFRIVCISVDPETDHVEQLKDYAEVFNADAKNWWFARHEGEAATHQYLEEVLKFFKIRERTDELDIASNGRFAHDLGFLLVDRDFNVIGKWPLADAASDEGRRLDPTNYDRLKKEMYETIEQELAKEDE